METSRQTHVQEPGAKRLHRGPSARRAQERGRRHEALEAAWHAILCVRIENVTIRGIAPELKATTRTVVHHLRSAGIVLRDALNQLLKGMVDEVMRHLEGVAGITSVDRIHHAFLLHEAEGKTA